MNKGDLVDSVATHLGMSKAVANRAVDAVITSIATGLRADRKVTISGFGTFTKKELAERLGVHPSTGERMKLPPTTTCGFKPSVMLREAI